MGDQEQELKACPFCGNKESTPKLEELAAWTGWKWRVACYACVVEMSSDTKEQAIERWNQRAEQQEGDEDFVPAVRV